MAIIDTKEVEKAARIGLVSAPNRRAVDLTPTTLSSTLSYGRASTFSHIPVAVVTETHLVGVDRVVDDAPTRDN